MTSTTAVVSTPVPEKPCLPGEENNTPSTVEDAELHLSVAGALPVSSTDDASANESDEPAEDCCLLKEAALDAETRRERVSQLLERFLHASFLAGGDDDIDDDEDAQTIRAQLLHHSRMDHRLTVPVAALAELAPLRELCSSTPNKSGKREDDASHSVVEWEVLMEAAKKSSKLVLHAMTAVEKASRREPLGAPPSRVGPATHTSSATSCALLLQLEASVGASPDLTTDVKTKLGNDAHALLLVAPIPGVCEAYATFVDAESCNSARCTLESLGDFTLANTIARVPTSPAVMAPPSPLDCSPGSPASSQPSAAAAAEATSSVAENNGGIVSAPPPSIDAALADELHVLEMLDQPDNPLSKAGHNTHAAPFIPMSLRREERASTTAPAMVAALPLLPPPPPPPPLPPMMAYHNRRGGRSARVMMNVAAPAHGSSAWWAAPPDSPSPSSTAPYASAGLRATTTTSAAYQPRATSPATAGEVGLGVLPRPTSTATRPVPLTVDEPAPKNNNNNNNLTSSSTSPRRGVALVPPTPILVEPELSGSLLGHSSPHSTRLRNDPYSMDSNFVECDDDELIPSSPSLSPVKASSEYVLHFEDPMVMIHQQQSSNKFASTTNSTNNNNYDVAEKATPSSTTTTNTNTTTTTTTTTSTGPKSFAEVIRHRAPVAAAATTAVAAAARDAATKTAQTAGRKTSSAANTNAGRTSAKSRSSRVAQQQQ